MDDFDLLLKWTNFMWNGIIIPMLLIMALFLKKAFTRGYIFQLTNYEHKGVSESIDSDDRNFSSAGLVE